MFDCSQITILFNDYSIIFTEDFFNKIDEMIMSEEPLIDAYFCDGEEYKIMHKNLNVKDILKKNTLTKDETIYLFFYITNIRSFFHINEEPYGTINVKLQDISNKLNDYFIKKEYNINSEREQSELEEIETNYSVRKGTIVERFYNKLKRITLETPELKNSKNSKSSWRHKRNPSSPSLQPSMYSMTWFSHRIKPHKSPQSSPQQSNQNSKKNSKNSLIGICGASEYERSKGLYLRNDSVVNVNYLIENLKNENNNNENGKMNEKNTPSTTPNTPQSGENKILKIVKCNQRGNSRFLCCFTTRKPKESK